MRLLEILAIAILIHNVTGSLMNSSCKKTKDLENYVCQCSINHTIYIKQHIIEDGFQRLSPIDNLLGCSTTNAVYCGAQFPVNHRIQRNNSAFAYFVKECNGKNRCNLSLDFFQRMETSLRKSCNNSKRPELQNATFRQSIDYECIQDDQVVDMCVNRKDTRSPRIYLQSTGNTESCSCHVSGDVHVLRVEILQTAMVELLMSGNGKFLYEHKNYSINLYGVQVPSSANEMVMKIKKHSTESRVLIKVMGNVTFYCMDEEFTTSTIGESRTRHPVAIDNSVLRRNHLQSNSYPTSQSELDLNDDDDIDVGTRRIPEENTTIFDNQESTDVAINLDSSLSSFSRFDDSWTWIITLLIAVLICLVFYLIVRQRRQDLNTALIHVSNAGDRFLLKLTSQGEVNSAQLEIHKAGCLCDQSETNTIQTPEQQYLPLENVNGNDVTTYSELSRTHDYTDISI